MSPFLGLDGGVGWLESRGDARWTPQFNNTNRTGNGLFQSSTNSTRQEFFNELRFAAAKSIRTSTIILATFNTIAAFATVVGILFDAYYRRKRNDKKFRFRYGSRRQKAGCWVKGLCGAFANNLIEGTDLRLFPQATSSLSFSLWASLFRASHSP